MTEVEQVRQQIEQAKQSAQEQRQLVEQKRQEAREAEATIGKQREILIEQEKKIPQPTQRLLRSGMFAGLEGRKRRQIVKKMKTELKSEKEKIKKGEKEIGLFRGELTKYEEEGIEPFEKEIAERETEVKAYEQEMSDWETAKTIVDKKIPIFGIGAGYSSSVEDKVRVIIADRQAYERRVSNLQQMKQEALSVSETPPLFGQSTSFKSTPIYSSSGKLVGIDTGTQSRLPTPSEKMFYGGFSIIPPVLEPPKMSVPRGMSRTDIVKDFNPFMKIVEQQSSIFDIPFRTTGSPIRMTKITSPKSRGYIPSIKTPIKKQIKKTSFIIKKVEPKKIKKKIKGRNLFGSDEDFLFGSKSKKSKKSNIWGF